MNLVQPYKYAFTSRFFLLLLMQTVSDRQKGKMSPRMNRDMRQRVDLYRTGKPALPEVMRRILREDAVIMTSYFEALM